MYMSPLPQSPAMYEYLLAMAKNSLGATVVHSSIIVSPIPEVCKELYLETLTSVQRVDPSIQILAITKLS